MNRTIVNPVVKDEVTFIKTSEESGGKSTEVMVSLVPGGGTPLHFHTSFAETFIAIEGDLSIGLAKDRNITLKPGDTFTAPANTLHRFYNAGVTPIRFKVVIKPGSTGFEQSLRIMYGLATDGLTNSQSIPKQLIHTAVIFKLGDTNGPGLLKILSPLLKWLARKAERNGVEQLLLNKYCS